MPEEKKENEKKAQDKPSIIERSIYGGIAGGILGLIVSLMDTFGFWPKNFFTSLLLSILLGIIIFSIVMPPIYKKDNKKQ